MRILKLEIKRILKTRLTIVLLCLALVLSVILAWLPVTFCYCNKQENGNTVELNGPPAIEYTKEVQAEIAGTVTPERVRLAVEQYQACLRNYGVENSYDLPDGVYGEEIFPYAPLIHSVKEAFADEKTGMAPSAMEIAPEEVDDFYDVCGEHIVSLMKMEQKEHPAAQKAAVTMYGNVEKPYQFFPGYSSNAMDYLIILAFLTVLFYAVIAAPVFTSDYQSGADDILRCTKYGKTKLAVTRILSALLICGVTYMLCTSVYLVLSNSFFGWETIKSSMQILYSVVNLGNMNIGQLQCFSGAAGLLCILATVSFTLFLSSNCKNTVISVAMALLFCVLPLILYLVLPAETGKYIYPVLPAGGVSLQVSILYAAIDFEFWNIGDIAIWLPHVMLLAYIIEIPLFAGLTVRSYCRHSMK